MRLCPLPFVTRSMFSANAPSTMRISHAFLLSLFPIGNPDELAPERVGRRLRVILDPPRAASTCAASRERLPELNVNQASPIGSLFSGTSLASTQTPAPIASNKASDMPSRSEDKTNKAALVSTSSRASPESQSRKLIRPL